MHEKIDRGKSKRSSLFVVLPGASEGQDVQTAEFSFDRGKVKSWKFRPEVTVWAFLSEIAFSESLTCTDRFRLFPTHSVLVAFLGRATSFAPFDHHAFFSGLASDFSTHQGRLHGPQRKKKRLTGWHDGLCMVWR